MIRPRTRRPSELPPQPPVSIIASARPLPAPPLPERLRLARELAGHLIELGDAAVTGGDAYYRAARFLDRDETDIEAAAREGNLSVLPWLEELRPDRLCGAVAGRAGAKTDAPDGPYRGRSNGNRMTSRIDRASVRSMTRRSMPRPRPPAGGMPYWSAST